MELKNYVWKLRQSNITNITLDLYQEVTLGLR